MLLLLARHGNTFETGEKAVWVGARTDLALTAKGREQARALGQALEPLKDRIARIIAGPLRRTHEHAAIAAGAMGCETRVEIDGRLREIDYGLWEGKTAEKIHALGGEDELKAWNERGIWPASPGWAPSPSDITATVAQLAENLAVELIGDRAALLVTSNGVLKFFLKLVPGAFEEMASRNSLKVATGNCCALRHGLSGWEIVFWNSPPGQLAFNEHFPHWK